MIKKSGGHCTSGTHLKWNINLFYVKLRSWNLFYKKRQSKSDFLIEFENFQFLQSYKVGNFFDGIAHWRKLNFLESIDFLLFFHFIPSVKLSFRHILLMVAKVFPNKFYFLFQVRWIQRNFSHPFSEHLMFFFACINILERYHHTFLIASLIHKWFHLLFPFFSVQNFSTLSFLDNLPCHTKYQRKTENASRV